MYRTGSDLHSVNNRPFVSYYNHNLLSSFPVFNHQIMLLTPPGSHESVFLFTSVYSQRWVFKPPSCFSPPGSRVCGRADVPAELFRDGAADVPVAQPLHLHPRQLRGQLLWLQGEEKRPSALRPSRPNTHTGAPAGAQRPPHTVAHRQVRAEDSSRLLAWMKGLTPPERWSQKKCLQWCGWSYQAKG